MVKNLDFTRKLLGLNLRSCMRIRGFTSKKMADALQEKYGVEISDEAVRHYISGDRPLETSLMVLMANVMDVNVQTLVEGLDTGDLQNPKVMPKLSPRDHQILRHIATECRADIHLMIVAMGVYAALPEDFAASAIMGIMAQASLAIITGAMKASELPEGVADLENAIGDLIANGKT